jgi:AraC family transcriptional regulator, transcriptional activator of pobA
VKIIRLSLILGNTLQPAKAFFFINSNQYVTIQKTGADAGGFIYYSRDFYCVQIHDAEVACDGLLFNNIFSIPVTKLNDKDKLFADNIFQHICEELAAHASNHEEMIRTYLKQLIIIATRIWNQQQLSKEVSNNNNEVELAGIFYM